ncbi:hypothetical protein NDA00_25095 [Funiculus sociatus GB2-M2]|nr:hypothetical protein [Trichocoleus sp. FACHB-90]
MLEAKPRAIASVDDLIQIFERSPESQEWRSWLHHFYDPFPTVEHYEVVAFG